MRRSIHILFSAHRSGEFVLLRVEGKVPAARLYTKEGKMTEMNAPKPAIPPHLKASEVDFYVYFTFLLLCALSKSLAWLNCITFYDWA